MNFEIEYWTNVVRTHPAIFKIDSDGVATFIFPSNENNPSIRDIGIYARNLNDDELVRLVDILNSQEFINLKNPPDALPGDEIHRFSVQHPVHGKVDKFLNQAENIPPSFQRAESAVRALTEILLKYPKYALSFYLDPLSETIYVHKVLKFTFFLENVGTEMIELTPPSEWSEGTGLEFRAVRHMIRPEELTQDSEMFFRWFSRKSIVSLDSDKSVSVKKLALQPKQRVAITAKLRLDCGPGLYDVKIAYQSDMKDIKGKNLVNFMIVSSQMRISIK